MLNNKEKRKVFKLGREGFALCIILLGVATLLFGTDSEFEGNYHFWRQLGWWSN
jgi:hypothetical protein